MIITTCSKDQGLLFLVNMVVPDFADSVKGHLLSMHTIPSSKNYLPSNHFRDTALMGVLHC